MDAYEMLQEDVRVARAERMRDDVEAALATVAERARQVAYHYPDAPAEDRPALLRELAWIRGQARALAEQV